MMYTCATKKFVLRMFLLFMTNLEKAKEKEKFFSCVLWRSYDEKCDGETCTQAERIDKKSTFLHTYYAKYNKKNAD